MEQASAHVLTAEAASRPAPASAGCSAVDLSLLRSSGAGCPSISQIEDPSRRSSSHWRDVLHRVAAEPQSSVLTDSFGCAPWSGVSLQG